MTSDTPLATFVEIHKERALLSKVVLVSSRWYAALTAVPALYDDSNTLADKIIADACDGLNLFEAKAIVFICGKQYVASLWPTSKSLILFLQKSLVLCGCIKYAHTVDHTADHD